MNISRFTFTLLFIGLSVLIFNRCFTVKYSTTGASIPPEAKTVSVKMFENRAPIVEPTLSQYITDELRDYIQRNTRLILVSGTGDLDFEGIIVEYDSRPTVISSTDYAPQNRFTIAVKVKYTNSFNSKENFETTFSRFVDYPSEMSFEAAKEQYTKEIVKLLIEDIFNKAFVNW